MATTPATDVGSAITQLESRMTKVELRRRGFATSVVTSMPTYAQDTAPVPPITTGAIWYDTSNNNTAYRWDGTQWIAVIDPSVDLARDTAAIDLVNAQDDGGSPDGHVTTTIQANPPTVGPVGDLWVDTDDNHLYRSNGVSWVDTGDTATGASIRRPENASTIADGKVQTWWQNNPPTPDGFGDLWVDTSQNPMSLYRWNNYDWVRVSDWSFTQISDKIDTKITTFRQPNVPTSTATGDIWFDTDDGNKEYRAAAKGANSIGVGGWVLVQDTAIQDAQDTADSKIRSYYQLSVPTSVSVGDVWFDTNNGNQQYRAMNVGAGSVEPAGSPTGWVLVQDQTIVNDLEDLKTDGLPPTSSPVPTVTDGISAMYLRWNQLVNPDPMSYDVHVSSESVYTPNSSNLVANTAGTIMTVKSGPLNLITNPTAREGVVGWLRANGTLEMTSEASYAGPTSFKLTATGTSAPYMYTPQGLAGFPVVAGQLYRAVGRLRTAVGLTGNGSINVTWYNSSGLTTGLPATLGPTTAVNGSGWTTVAVTALAPVGAVFAAVTVGMSGTVVSGSVYYVDGIELLDPSQDGPLIPEMPYYFRIVARDADGPSPNPSTPAVVGQIRLATNEDISVNYLYAGQVSASQISAGTIDSEVIIAGSFKTADNGRHVEIDPLGVRLYATDGRVLVNLPTTIGENPKFTGSLEAADMVVQDSLSLYGQNNYFATGSQVKLQTSTSAPSTALTLSSDYETWAAINNPPYAVLGAPYFVPRDSWCSVNEQSGKSVGEFFGTGIIFANNFRYAWPLITTAEGRQISTFIPSGVTDVYANGKQLTLVSATWRQAGQADAAAQSVILLLDCSTMTADNVAPTQLAYITATPSWFYGFRKLGPILGASTSYRHQACAIISRGNGLWTFETYSVAFSSGTYSITKDSTWDMPTPVNCVDPMPSGVVYTEAVTGGFPGVTPGQWCVSASALDTDGVTRAHVFNGFTAAEIPNHNFPLTTDPVFVFFAGHDPITNTFGGFKSIDNGGLNSTVTRYTSTTWTTESSQWWGTYTWKDSNTTGLQQLRTGGATGGTFTLSYGVQTTTALSYDAAPTAVALALNALSSLAGRVSVTMFPGETSGLPGNRLAIQIDSDGTPPNMLTFSSSLTGASTPGISTPPESQTHETDMATVSTALTMKKRSRLNVTLPAFPAPQAGVGKLRSHNDVNSAIIYLGRNATTPTRTQLWKQATQPTPMVNFIQYNSIPNFSAVSNPPAINDFPSSAAALLQSSSNNSYGVNKLTLNGDGFAHLETLDMHTPNTLTAALTGSVFDQLMYVTRANSGIQGGGVKSVDFTLGVTWSDRFILISNGRSSWTTTGGFVDVTMPGNGTVVTGYGGAANKTVASGRIPMDSYTTLYYAPPWGQTGTTVNASFKLVSYTADFSVPHDWIRVVSKDQTAVKWATGEVSFPWLSLASGSGWASTSTATREGNVVTINVAADKTSWAGGETIATLPTLLFAPSSAKYFSVISTPSALYQPVRVLTTGAVLTVLGSGGQTGITGCISYII